ncbi:Hypothetical protein R9X50_00502200 [Acrodontium crateriforme]|uniref:MIF4G domain-containing protein n=1 Tax=Acrodontium crateriforme TaxID=150365 RepID=A0AAQ3M754_9PEZI|nr:Hypothetical protein R9X50_00502200 [Acrodontium crateriforme]
MTSASAKSAQSLPASDAASSASTRTTSPSSGAVPAQLPVRSYANATKTATQTPPTAAGASAQNAKSTNSPVNGTTPMAQGGSQAANTTAVPNGTADHGRKPSVVINASGATGYTPNGGPVGQTGRPPITFGSINNSSPVPQASVPHQSPAPASTQASNPRVISPAHSPQPIPQPQASGGRPPSNLQGQGNGVTFGSVAEGDQRQSSTGPLGPNTPMHERRTSSQSMQSDMSNPSMNRQFPPNGRGRGGYPNQQFGMGSPAQNFRPLPGQARPANTPQQFHQQAPNSPYGRPRVPASPANMPSQPHMPQQHMGGNPQMQYGGYPQQPMHPQQVYLPNFSATATSTARSDSVQSLPMVASSSDRENALTQMNGYQPADTSAECRVAPHVLVNSHLTNSSPQHMYPQGFDPNSGYYQPYYYQQYPGQAPPQSPRPYPHAYGTGAPAGMQAPFNPPDMSRSTSQSSQRPPSSLGQPQTPSTTHAQPGTPGPAQPGSAAPSTNFVRPVKKSAIKITDANGNEINFNKSSPTPSMQSQSSAPVIVSTPNTQTPPPRVPSSQASRTETKTPNAKSAEETKAAFQEQVKRQMEEKRKEEEAAKGKTEEPKVEETKAKDVAAEPKKAEEAAAPAAAVESKDTKEETEDERLEREIAEMEAAEKEEEERERAYNEKKAKAKAEAAARQAEKDKDRDAELKRQEAEAEARELAREKERETGKDKATEGADEEAKSLFASLKKPTLGPGASASGTETPDSDAEAVSTAAAKEEGRAAQKPKPAHLKLETAKRVEPAEPTPGMQALKSARFLEVKEEAKYPDGFKSPNPALIAGGRKGRVYDKDFLLQFQNVFKEKPSIDWDQKVKETLGPSDEPRSARNTPGGKTPSTRTGPGGFPPMQSMGQFGARTLPSGTTSEQRFAASSGRGGMAMPGGLGGRVPSGLGMGAPMRTNSMPQGGRQGSTRGPRGDSKRGNTNRRAEAEMANKMPLTANMEIAPLEKSKTGWQPTSLVASPMANAPDPSGNMAPDMVQRKVKAALNKMTPEKFDKISDQILEIAGQSKNESDGRTLRQVIQLTFEKACDEAHWAGMYAQFCHKMLTTMSTEIRDETIKDKAGNPVIGGALFRKYLLNRCQEEFERGWQANLPDKPEGESQEAVLLSDEYYVAAAAKRRGLGLIQFIGQLYKLRMLTLRIMHECVMRLLNFEGPPDEAAVENLTTLLRAVGGTMDEEEQGRALMNTYFQRIDETLLKTDALGSRPKFMIMDLIDLRKAGWKGKDDSKGPKTIEQIHAEAAAAQAKAEAERQRTSQRGGPGGGRMPQGRGDARQFSNGGMAPPVDYARTNVNMDDLRRLQNRGASQRSTGGGLGPGGSLGPGSALGARSGSRRGIGPPSSGNTTRTNTPPVGEKEKKDETQSNAFSALAALDPSGESQEDSTEATKAEKAEESSNA